MQKIMKAITSSFLITMMCFCATWANVPGSVQGDIMAGKAKAAACAACHGVDGNSTDSTYPVLAGQQVDYIIKQLEDFQSGNRVNALMSPMAKGLSDQDRADLAAYFSSQFAKPRAVDNKYVEQGRLLYFGGDASRGIPACMACHGPRGAGLAQAKFPKLSAQHPEYIATQLKNFRVGTRENDMNEMMRLLAFKLNDQDIEALAHFVSALH